jgi:hypothetical protein
VPAAYRARPRVGNKIFHTTQDCIRRITPLRVNALSVDTKLLPHQAAARLHITAALAAVAFRSSFRGEAALPTTHKPQLDLLQNMTGASDFAGLHAAVQGWNQQRQTLFAALGGTGDIPANYDFAAAITSRLQTEQAICSALGITDVAQAETRIREMTAQANAFTALAAELGTKEKPITDAAGATAAIGELRTAVTDFEGRVNKEVVNRAASAGIQTPVAKVPEEQQKPNTMARADWRALTAIDQRAFFQKGGVLTD